MDGTDGATAGCGFLMCAMGAVFYWISRLKGRDAEKLTSTPYVTNLGDLPGHLRTANTALASMVAVAGLVGSAEPLSCRKSGGRAVIIEETTEQQLMRFSDSRWVPDTGLRQCTLKETPWYLEDSSGRLEVVGAKSAAGLGPTLTLTSDVLENSQPSATKGALDLLQGIKLVGLRRVERSLPVGLRLTLVGEVVEDEGGTVRIRRPQGGGAFYLSSLRLPDLIADLGECSRVYRSAALVCGLSGLGVLIYSALKELGARRQRAQAQKRLAEAAARQQLREANGEGQGGGGVCVICIDKECNAAFVPCGHMCCCIHCTEALTTCPLCRARIDRVLRTYSN